MESTPPISVCTTTKNSAPDIYRLLESIKPIAEEIVVLDSESTDGTREICGHFGAEIYDHEFSGFADLKRSAIEKATNDWVLIIDSDEVVPPSLREEIIRSVGRTDVDAFYIKKKNIMFGKETNIVHPKRPYLAKKEVIEYKNEYMNEKLSVKNEYKHRTADFENKIIHFAYDSFDGYLSKWDQYASLDALQAVENDSMDSFWYFLGEGILHWGYHLFKERAIFDGRTGVLFSFMSLQYKIVVWWKVRQIKDLRDESPNKWKEIWIQEKCQR